MEMEERTVEVEECGRNYGGSFKAMDELVDESVLGGGWANHQVFFKAS